MWEIINDLIYALIILISVILFGILILNDYNSLKSKKSIIVFSIVCILQAITFAYFNGTIKTLIMCLTNVILFRYIFNISYSKSITIVALYTLLLMIMELIEILFITKIIKMDATYGTTVFANSILSHIVITILMVITTFLLRKILRKIVSIKLENNIQIIIYGILTITCIVIFFYKAFSSLIINVDSIIGIFVMIVFLAILISLIRQTINNNRIKEEYDKLLEFMTTYENEIEKQRILRHETKNEFLSIRAKLCDNLYKESCFGMGKR